MQRIAIIDIGSNSARLVISHIYKNGAYNMVYNQKKHCGSVRSLIKPVV